MKLAALLLIAVSAMSAGDLAAVRAEPDPEKRSEKALQAAESSFQMAKKASKEGDAAAESAGLAGVREAVELAMKSLEESGKDARRSPKYFKKAEITLRKLTRDLDDLRFAKSVDDRKPAEELLVVVHEAHDKVLLGIMTKKK